MYFKSCFVVEDMARKKAQHLVFSSTGLLPSRHWAERWVCSWCLPTLGRVCLIYMKGILLSSGRRSGGNTLRAAAKGGEQGGAGSHPTHRRLHRWGVSVYPAPPGGTPRRRWGGLEIWGDALVVLPNSTDMFLLIGCNFFSLRWYLLCLITDIAGCWGSRALPLSFYCRSARAGKTAELIFALAFPSV